MKTETPAEFSDRVTKIARASGIKIKDYSHSFAANFVRGENENTAALNDSIVAQSMIDFARLRPDQVILLKPLERLAPPPRETAAGKLERANSAHAAANPSEPQRTQMTEEQRKWIAKHPDQALGLANEIAHGPAKAKP